MNAPSDHQAASLHHRTHPCRQALRRGTTGCTNDVRQTSGPRSTQRRRSPTLSFLPAAGYGTAPAPRARNGRAPALHDPARRPTSRLLTRNSNVDYHAYAGVSGLILAALRPIDHYHKLRKALHFPHIHLRTTRSLPRTPSFRSPVQGPLAARVVTTCRAALQPRRRARDVQ